MMGQTRLYPLLLALLLSVALPPRAAGASEAEDLILSRPAPAAGHVWAALRDDARGTRQTRVEALPGTDADGTALTTLREATDAGARTLSRLPAVAGDPVVVHFLEAVTRDVTDLASGSPFYIRNRIKDALRQGGEVRRADAVTTVELVPFRGDPNAARMGGFDTLTLRFDLDPDPAGPIRHLRAETAGPVTGGKPYVLDLTLTPEVPK